LTTTQAALSRYLKIEGQPTNNPVVTKEIVAELVKHSTRVCPLECRAGETLKGEVCVAEDKPAPVAPAALSATRKNSDDEDNARSRRKAATRDRDSDQDRPRRQQATRERDRDQDQPRRQQVQRLVSQPEPHARQQALARPSVISGGGGGGGGGGG